MLDSGVPKFSPSDFLDLVMDSRDLSASQSTAAGNRDTATATVASASSSTTPTAADDDVVLSVTAALAKDAASHFHSRRYTECLAVLHQLKLKKEDDPKVITYASNYIDMVAFLFLIFGFSRVMDAA